MTDLRQSLVQYLYENANVRSFAWPDKVIDALLDWLAANVTALADTIDPNTGLVGTTMHAGTISGLIEALRRE